MNRLFVANKPPFISSNYFLGRLKKKYGAKKAGFSGTLDPIAKGVLIVAFGKYTRLFRFLKKAPKTYRATLWLGAFSEGLDIEKVSKVEEISKIDVNKIELEIKKLENITSQIPPRFSAKWVDGVRAYDLARRGEDVELKSMPVTIYETNFINYTHPFITFEATVSEGTYIRSLAQTLCENIKSFGVLSSLERVREGSFLYENEKALDIIEHIDLESNIYNGDEQDILLGKKVNREDFQKCETGTYKLIQKKTISILEITDEKVIYHINRLEI